jgi:L-ribulose-5-phosphate 4-epimerase
MNVSEACRELAAHGLVPWSSGNASVRESHVSKECPSGMDYMRIKGTGFRCSRATDTNIALVQIVDGYICGEPKPSTDSEAHRWIYNHLPDINGVVHTHSHYATTFAVSHKEIPCCMTQMEDVFGGNIPLSEYCQIGGEDIGKEVVRLYERTHVPAVLIRSHGLFTIGDTLENAVRNAILAEHCAAIAWRAMQMGNVFVPSKEEIAKNHERYTNEYGQP